MTDTNNKKKIGLGFPTVELIYGITCVGCALLAYGLFTLLPNVNKTWQRVSLWLQIVLFAVCAIIFLFGFLKLIIEYLQEVADYLRDRKKG